jgi:UDP-4-amino-4,6-dideoxy-N-acetyl-beta-L-altrosamine transaminase
MTIPYSRQSINKKDIAAVKKVLNSDFLTQGPQVEKFENALKKKFNSKFCSVVNSATSGLYLACRSAKIGYKDIVWTSINTFVSTANVILHCGAQVEFLDINFDGNIDVTNLEKKLINAEKIKKLPKALIVVHFAGLSCDMEKILFLSKKYQFKIIEDASHAAGGTYKGHKIGSCKYSDFCVFSFHAIKSITTGEGGAVFSKIKKDDEKIKLLRSHGINKNKKKFFDKSKANYDWYYEVIDIGFNFRLTDFQCALGISQLNRLDLFISKRRHLAKNYINQVKNNKLILPKIYKNNLSAWHLFIVRCDTPKNREKLYNYLKKNNVASVLHYIPINFHYFYRKKKNQKFVNAKKYYDTALSIPIFPNLKKNDTKKIINLLNKF